MFGNQYEQAVTDEALARESRANTQGMTGWAAITQGMSNAGSGLGFAAGKAFGGRTDAEVKQDNYASIVGSIPNFDPSNPEQLAEMSSAMWQGGFYDEGMQMMARGQDITAANIKNDYYKAQTAAEGVPKAPSPTEVIATEKALRNKTATSLVANLPVTTSAEIQVVADTLRAGGFADTAQYKDLMRNLTTRLSYESKEDKDAQTDLEQEKVVETADVTLRYKPVMEVGKGVALVDGFFLDNAPAGLGNEDRGALSKQIGGLIETYDNTLSTDRGEVSPGEAVAFYERALTLPEVYTANQDNFQGMNPLEWIKGSKFSSDAFRNTLDKSFSRNGQSVSGQELFKFANAGLIIPGVTVIDMGGGNVGTITAEGLANYLATDLAEVPGG